MVKEIIDVMKELQKKGFFLTTSFQYEDVNLRWKDKMEIEEDNLWPIFKGNHSLDQKDQI